MRTLAPLVALALALPAEAAPPSPGAPAVRGSPSASALVAGTRAVGRYLDAVRLSGPSPLASSPARVLPVSEEDYAPAKALTAPRTLEEIEARRARGEHHEMAPWLRADRDRLLESFDLLGARRAPRGAVVVTVRERYYVVGEGGTRLHAVVSEYLAARVGGAWRVVDRRADRRFSDDEIADRYPGYWDP